MNLNSSKRIAFFGAGLVALQFITASAFAQTTSYRIIDRWKNSYVCDTGANATYQASNPGTNCQWSIIDVAGGFKSFRNVATNDYLHIENQTGVVQAAGGDASWYSADWTLETIDSTYSWIRNRWQSTQYMHVENQTGAVQSGVIDKTWWGSQWRFEAVTTATSSSASSSSSQAPVDKITVYQHADYAGWSATYSVGSYNYNAFVAAGGVNDDASSVRVPSGYQVTLYEHGDFTGASLTLTANSNNIGNLMNDKVSALVVSKVGTTSSSSSSAQTSSKSSSSTPTTSSS
ncbi:MAG: hypothetical protein EOO68_31135, partial [Moraxellaceae bacterium]